MKTDRARTQQEIFSEMHRELRAWNPQIPESSERLDPVLRILLQLYSNQLSKIDSRVDRLWDVATNSLLRSLYPECKRWPVPAHTVMKTEPIDPVVDVDPHTRLFYKEKREGGQTFYFSAQRQERLVKAEMKYAFLKVGDKISELAERTDDFESIGMTDDLPFSSSEHGQILLAFEHVGQPTDFENAALFIDANDESLGQMRWAKWYPSSASGDFYEDSGFCPGLTCTIDDIINPGDTQREWGGLRSSTDLFKQLEDNWVIIPPAFAQTWELAPPDPLVADKLEDNDERLYWIRLDLPPGGDKKKLLSKMHAYFGCFIAINKNELTLFKHTGGNRIVEIELPEQIENILDIESVVDSNGEEYLPHYALHTGASSGSYSLEQRDGKLVLWFDYSSKLDSPPNSLTVTYSVTSGTRANGIEAGEISELYENHPGIESLENLFPTQGAIPAKTEEQIVAEVSARLRDRDRALSFAEIASWSTNFDPRIKKAKCENGIERAERGVRRCIVVKALVDSQGFFSDDETELLRSRLADFLKSRSPVNTRFKVEISKR